MPEQETVKRAQRDLREGKSPSTAAGEFVHEEIEHVREGFGLGDSWNSFEPCVRRTEVVTDSRLGQIATV